MLRSTFPLTSGPLTSGYLSPHTAPVRPVVPTRPHVIATVIRFLVTVNGVFTLVISKEVCLYSNKVLNENYAFFSIFIRMIVNAFRSLRGLDEDREVQKYVLFELQFLLLQ